MSGEGTSCIYVGFSDQSRAWLETLSTVIWVYVIGFCFLHKPVYSHPHKHRATVKYICTVKQHLLHVLVVFAFVLKQREKLINRSSFLQVTLSQRHLATRSNVIAFVLLVSPPTPKRLAVLCETGRVKSCTAQLCSRKAIRFTHCCFQQPFQHRANLTKTCKLVRSAQKAGSDQRITELCNHLYTV